jgi:Tfp pilus assembly protein PilF
LKEMAALRFLDGDFDGALAANGNALRIDPEDVDAHYHRMKCYEGLGREVEAAEARRAYLKYKDDDNARKRTRDFLLTDEAMNREAQRIHVHR